MDGSKTQESKSRAANTGVEVRCFKRRIEFRIDCDSEDAVARDLLLLYTMAGKMSRELNTRVIFRT